MLDQGLFHGGAAERRLRVKVCQLVLLSSRVDSGHTCIAAPLTRDIHGKLRRFVPVMPAHHLFMQHTRLPLVREPAKILCFCNLRRVIVLHVIILRLRKLQLLITNDKARVRAGCQKVKHIRQHREYRAKNHKLKFCCTYNNPFPKIDRKLSSDIFREMLHSEKDTKVCSNRYIAGFIRFCQNIVFRWN